MRFADRVRRRLTGRRDKTVRECAAYMPEILRWTTYLYGFWGCEKYYEDIIPLAGENCVPGEQQSENADALRAMAGENAVSVHIRRKDYLTVADGKRYMGICTDAYYRVPSAI